VPRSGPLAASRASSQRDLTPNTALAERRHLAGGLFHQHRRTWKLSPAASMSVPSVGGCAEKALCGWKARRCGQGQPIALMDSRRPSGPENELKPRCAGLRPEYAAAARSTNGGAAFFEQRVRSARRFRLLRHPPAHAARPPSMPPGTTQQPAANVGARELNDPRPLLNGVILSASLIPALS